MQRYALHLFVCGTNKGENFCTCFIPRNFYICKVWADRF